MERERYGLIHNWHYIVCCSVLQCVAVCCGERRRENRRDRKGEIEKARGMA